MSDGALVLLSLTGRPQILTMPWSHARDRFVSMFGTRAVRDCMDTLGRGHEWVGKSANHPGLSLSVELAQPTPKGGA